MGEDIRIFHIEIIHLIGCNITTVIVIIFTERTFELLFPWFQFFNFFGNSGKLLIQFYMLDGIQNTGFFFK